MRREGAALAGCLMLAGACAGGQRRPPLEPARLHEVEGQIAARPAPVEGESPPVEETPGGPGSARSGWMLGFAGALQYGELKRPGGGDTVINPGFLLIPVLHVSAQAGAILSPRLVVGGEASVGMLSGSGDEYVDFNLAHFLGVATWFPRETGFLLRGGLGWAVIHGRRYRGSPPVSVGRFAGNGPAALAGIGYVLASLSSSHLRVGLDLEAAQYVGGTAESMGTWVTDLTIGFDWY